MTVDEIMERLKPQLFIQGESMDVWLKTEIEDSVDMVINYLESNMDETFEELPKQLYWIIKKMVQVAFNRQRSEGVTSHTEGGETLSWGNNGMDSLEPFIEPLNDFIDGSSKRNSWDFW